MEFLLHPLFWNNKATLTLRQGSQEQFQEPVCKAFSVFLPPDIHILLGRSERSAVCRHLGTESIFGPFIDYFCILSVHVTRHTIISLCFFMENLSFAREIPLCKNRMWGKY